MLVEDLEDYLVVRVDERTGWSREVAGESELEGEAIRIAGALSMLEVGGGVFYEVRASRGYALVYSTVDEVLDGDAACAR